MKVDNILIGKKCSEHLYYLETDINAKDVLVILRFLAPKGKSLGYLYDRNPIMYTNSESITKSEFDFVLEHCNKDRSSWLERYSRENLIDRVGSAIRIITSTTKTEIIQKVVRNKELFYRSFGKDFVENHCSKWSDFRKSKIFLPAVSNSEKNLVFTLSSAAKPLSGKNYLQYWRFSPKHGHIDLTPDYETEIINDCLAINLKDSDDIILKKMHKYLEAHRNEKEFDLDEVKNSISEDDLDVKDAEGFSYEYSIFALASYFGQRRGSRFKTFLEGLRQRKDIQTANKCLNKRFLIATHSNVIYCGTVHDQEFFEKIAVYLKIEYLKDKRILCRVVQEETNETITALWEMLGGNTCNQFSIVEL